MFAAKNFLLTPPASTFSAVSLIGTNSSAAAGLTIPSYQVGDLFVYFAYDQDGTTALTPPTGGGTVPNWITLDANTGSDNNASATAYAVATRTGHTSGSWNFATNYVAIAVLRGQSATTPIGGHAESGSSSTSGATAPAITLTRTDNTSKILHFFGRADGDWNSWNAAPAGYTQLQALGGGGAGVALISKASTTSDGAATQGTDGSASVGYRGTTVEITAH